MQDPAMKPLHGLPEGILRGNFQEMFGTLHTAQCQVGNAKPRCAEFQMNAAECLEAYGAKRGRRVCKPFLDDYTECLHSYIQVRPVCVTIGLMLTIAIAVPKSGRNEQRKTQTSDER